MDKLLDEESVLQQECTVLQEKFRFESSTDRQKPVIIRQTQSDLSTKSTDSNMLPEVAAFQVNRFHEC